MDKQAGILDKLSLKRKKAWYKVLAEHAASIAAGVKARYQGLPKGARIGIPAGIGAAGLTGAGVAIAKRQKKRW